MKRVLPFFLLILLLSCNSNQDVPEGILADSTMKSIIVDLSIVDASFNMSLSSFTAPKFKSELFYEEVMKQHKTSREEFNRSMKFYAQNTKRLQKIYEDALIDLSHKQVEVNK